MKHSIFTAAVAVITLTSLTACNPDGTMSGPLASWGPTVVAGNANFVTVKDAIGAPDGRLKAATRHCAKYGKSPAYQSKGGDSYECSGTTWCITYECK